MIRQDEWEHISSFLDMKTLYSTFRCISRMHYSIGYLFQEKQSPVERRKSIINKTSYKSKVKSIQLTSIDTIWNNIFGNKYNCPLSSLLWDILCLPFGFFIGGSKAMLIAHEIFSFSYNKTQYQYSDIDIYCINNKETCNITEIENALFNLLEKSGLKYYINVKKFILNIVFENTEYPIIQIILHIKNNMDEFMDFIDLPNTQFAFKLSVNKIKELYYTDNAYFALQNKINIIYDPVIGTTINRIQKYYNKGFLTVVMSPYGYERDHSQRVLSVFDSLSLYINRIYVDCYLSDIFKYKDLVFSDFDYNSFAYNDICSNNNNITLQFYRHSTNIDNTRIIRILTFLNISIINIIKEISIEKFIVFSDNDFWYETHYIGEQYIEHIIHHFKFSYQKLYLHQYKYDEREPFIHSFSNYKNLRKKNYKNISKFPYYCILTGKELLTLNTQALFYFDFNIRFLFQSGLITEY